MVRADESPAAPAHLRAHGLAAEQLAQAAGVPGADMIPHGSELFVGFTSSQKAALGPSKIANHETLGFVDVGASPYFNGGTHMHLSHIVEDLEAW